jgi:uncharacterized RDD family membrane protein YckC
VTATEAAGGGVRLAKDGEAGLVTRVLAFFADVVIIDVVAWLVGGIVAVVASLFDLPDAVTDVLLIAGAAAGVAWAVGYFIFFWSTTGQTPGNRLMEIRVRSGAADAPLTPGRAALRVLGAIVSALLLFLGFALILVEPRRRGLHDLIAGSVVVYAPGRRRRIDTP